MSFLSPHTRYLPRLLRSLALLLVLILIGASIPVNAQPSYQYVYDETNQLVKVLDSTGVLIEYVYDEVGNILEIKRLIIAPLGILDVIPWFGIAGKLITIRGIGFSEVLIENEVAFNGVPATVLSATTSTLEVTVPVGATTGPVSITVAPNSTSTDRDFIVLHVPIIDSVNPHAALPLSVIDNVLVTGENLVGITFEFLPVTDPLQLLALPITFSADGTSALIDVSVSADALGEYVLTATNEAGTSDTNPTVANIFTVFANGDGDADGDGLTDGEEIELRTDPFNEDTDGDGWPDEAEVSGLGDPLDADAGPFFPIVVSRPMIRIKRLEAGIEPANNTIVVSRPMIRIKRLEAGIEPANNTIVVSRPKIEANRFEAGSEPTENTIVATPPKITVEREEL